MPLVTQHFDSLSATVDEIERELIYLKKLVANTVQLIEERVQALKVKLREQASLISAEPSNPICVDN